MEDGNTKLHCRRAEKEFYRNCLESVYTIECGVNCKGGVCYKLYRENLKVPTGTMIISDNKQYALSAQVRKTTQKVPKENFY